MQILTLNELNKLDCASSVALGCFDGLHIGHKAVIDVAVEFAQRHSLKSVVYKLKRNDESLIPRDETVETLRSWGVDVLITQTLDDAFMNLSCDEFVEEYLHNRLRAKFVSVGYNYRFGKSAAGNAALLSTLCAPFGIEVAVIPPVCVDNEVVSSSKIRSCLKNGDIAKVAQFLGRPYK
ncbi:MAG: hypothetical protein FWE04_07545 [Oscillospiraceae bacterium]|nr:hypothetical protein [Oscillospiraceae bacterium]